MINIKELSVGNYVLHLGAVNKVGEIISFTEVVIFQEKYYGLHSNTVSLNEIEPIPLTLEILEKNGGFYPKGSMWMKLDNHYRELWICKHTDGTYWLYSSGDCDKDENFAEIRYVHQLQNALTLCGINKEIKL